MSIYRIYAGADGESHMEEVHLEQHALSSPSPVRA